MYNVFEQKSDLKFQNIFVNEKNASLYKEPVFDWLLLDYEQKGKPVGHFWHNKDLIDSAFDECKAMIVLNDQHEVCGFMTWNFYDNPCLVEIGFVEVKEDYRRRGIFSAMLSDFLIKFDNTHVLFLLAIKKSERIFENMGWKEIKSPYSSRCKKYYKPIKPFIKESKTLPVGHVIGICKEDYYAVRNDPTNYPMKYFKIDLDDDGELIRPILTEFHYEGYVGIYFDKKLIIDGKSKHLFNNNPCVFQFGSIFISSIKPEDLKCDYRTDRMISDICREKGFFPVKNIDSSNKFKEKKSIETSNNSRKRGKESRNTVDLVDKIDEFKKRKKIPQIKQRKKEKKQAKNLIQFGLITNDKQTPQSNDLLATNIVQLLDKVPHEKKDYRNKKN